MANKYLDFEWELGKEKVYVTISQYQNGNIYVGLGPNFCDITVNIKKLNHWEGTIDTPNVPELSDFLENNGIAVDTLKRVQNGFNTYPVYKFSRSRLQELNKKELQIYLDNC